MDFDRLLEELHTHGTSLARSADYAPFDTAVPSCPGWTIGRLLGHLAKVHRWAAHLVRTGLTDGFQYERPNEDQLISFFLAGLDELLVALRRLPEDRPLPTLWPARSPRLFWARRQAHETAIHRLDLELAVGYGVAEFEPDFAADGIDELIMGIAPDRLTAGRGTASVVIEPLDRNISWTLNLSPDGLDVRREAVSGAELNVFGLSSDLYRWAWNRAGDDEVSLRGNLVMADWWRRTVVVNANSR